MPQQIRRAAAQRQWRRDAPAHGKIGARAMLAGAECQRIPRLEAEAAPGDEWMAIECRLAVRAGERCHEWCTALVDQRWTKQRYFQRSRSWLVVQEQIGPAQ